MTRISSYSALERIRDAHLQAPLQQSFRFRTPEENPELTEERKLSRKSTAEIISIGNELLIGHTLDTNSHWIAKQLTRLGWTLERVTQLRDSLDSIKSGVRGSLKRNPSVLITIGGLGPTPDDMTLAGISRAIDKPMRLNKEALQLVKDHYRRLESKPQARGRESEIRPLILLHIYNVEPGAEKEISEASARIMLQLAAIRA